jgi:trigger factor
VDAQVEDAGPCRKRIRVTVPAERVREEIDQAFQDLMRHAQVPGFRPGHLPRKVAEMRFGRALRREVKGGLLEKAFGEVLEARSLVPIGRPDLSGGEEDLDASKPFAFEVTVEVRPEVAIPDLKGLSVKRPVVPVTEADVDEAVEGLRLDRAELHPAEDGIVAERDVVVLDAAVLVGGERILDAENLQYRHPSEVVAGVAAPGVAKAILGKKRDEELTVGTTLPANFRIPEHAGKEAELRLAVRDVKRFHLPALDAEFAKALDFESVEDLRAQARKAVEREKAAEAEKLLDDALLDAVLARAPIALPENIVKNEIGQVLARYQADLHLQGAPPEAIEERLAKVQGEAASHVEREFRVMFLVEEFAKRRGFFVTEGEVDEQIQLMAGLYGRTPDDMRNYLEQRDLLPSLRDRLRKRKVLEALRKEAAIEG